MDDVMLEKLSEKIYLGKSIPHEEPPDRWVCLQAELRRSRAAVPVRVIQVVDNGRQSRVERADIEDVGFAPTALPFRAGWPNLRPIDGSIVSHFATRSIFDLVMATGSSGSASRWRRVFRPRG